MDVANSNTDTAIHTNNVQNFPLELDKPTIILRFPAEHSDKLELTLVGVVSGAQLTIAAAFLKIMGNQEISRTLAVNAERLTRRSPILVPGLPVVRR